MSANANFFSRTALVAFFAAAALPVAHAAVDWEDEEEFDARSWRSATLIWAQNIDPAHPPLSQVSGETPPPREMWVFPQYDDTPEACAWFDAALEGWIASYLDLPAGAPVPPGAIATYPWEAQSSCSN